MIMTFTSFAILWSKWSVNTQPYHTFEEGDIGVCSVAVLALIILVQCCGDAKPCDV